jgi:outer membrane protein OmpA-like peptidoglycan-associated protein
MRIFLAGFCFLFCTALHSQNRFTVHFEFNRYGLTDEARSQLDSFLLAAKEYSPVTEIRLNGHCDAIGSEQYNIELSKKRVAAVKSYLLAHAIDRNRFTETIGHGKKEPLNENRTAGERLLNRRVEISFIQPTTTKTGSLKEKIADSSVTSGTNIVLRNINFEGGTHLFLMEAQPMLDELLDAMRGYPKLVIRIEGHICCHEDSGDGMDNGTGINNLSEARARAVQEYLITNGIDASRVSYKGFVHSRPIYAFPEKSEEERIQNRRVELKIISK